METQLDGMRLDQALTTLFPDHSRTYFQFLIEEGFVVVNQKKLKKRELLSLGDLLEVHFQKMAPTEVTPQDIPLKVLYEDDVIVVIDKPQGMVAHPAPGHLDSTVANALLFHCKDLEYDHEELRPGIVHRLDKDTSGIMVLAKTYEAHKSLIEQFMAREVQKTYLALCVGTPKVDLIETRIGRHPTKRQRMAALHEGGKEALTYVKVLQSKRGFSIVEAKPHTGRTHQIRVHLEHIGCPILGDPIYGLPGMNKNHDFFKQCLHSYSISFIHPTKKNRVEFNTSLPSWYNFLE